MAIWGGAGLDIKKCLAKFHGQGSSAATGHLPGSTFPGFDLPNRSDDGRGTTGKYFGYRPTGAAISPVFNTYSAFIASDPEVFGDRKQGLPRDARQQGTG